MADTAAPVIQIDGPLAKRGRSSKNCPLARSLGVVSSRSAFLVLREAFYGATRFDQFVAGAEISEPIAAARLRELTDAGLLEKVPYQEPGQRTRYEYRLTEMGADLLPALTALMAWGDRWLFPNRARVQLAHAGCGGEVGVQLTCAKGHDVADDELELELELDQVGDSFVRIELVLGDITDQEVDAIVNAANSSLLGGSGVDGAIHRRGGPAIVEACREIRRTTWPDGLPAGEAVATIAGDLTARWVIHTVGPVYERSAPHSEALASAYRHSLEVAADLGATTIAFPAISTGVYGWPLDDAARIAVSAVNSSAAQVAFVRFVLFDENAYVAFQRALEREGLRSD